ncbi:hypothetical protein [Microbispora rosea]|uniref:hypothetical protein n=1 Tax=Microbispora rosea TaxID=58117 RepID=UPI0037A6D8B1
MRRSVAISLTTALVAAFGAAVAATFALILPGPAPTTTASVRQTTSDLAAPRMPKLWFQDVETATRAVAALGFVPEIHTLIDEEMKVPADWIVLGQAPAPGKLLKSTMRIEFDVTRKDVPVPSPTTASAHPS